MINITTNIAQVIGGIISKTASLASDEGKDKLARGLALLTAGNMARRIHNDGKKADGSDIGTYSEGYMKVRTGNFGNNVYTRGKNKGKPREGNAGVYSRGKKKGQQRPRYNRTSDTKVVFSLSRDMENDFSLGRLKNPDSEQNPIKTSTGYGVGWKKDTNVKKAGYVDAIYPGVYQLSQYERSEIQKAADKFVKDNYQLR